MKKKIMLVLLLFLFAGCSLSNTPTSKVEELLGKYQSLDSSINISTATLTQNRTVDDDINDRYKKVIKKQYENLTYEIKEEKIDGEIATITTQIEVLDYKSIINKYDMIKYDESEYDKVLDDLENAKEKIVYTIDFTLTKDKKGDWNVDDLTTEQVNKLLGMY